MDQIPDRRRESADQTVLSSRLLPRVSFQTMLVLTAVAAVLIAVVYAAEQGGVYAAGISVGLFFAAAMLVASAVVFLLSWSIAFLPKVCGAVLIGFGVLLFILRLLGVSLAAADFLKDTIWILDCLVIGCFLFVVPIGEQSGEHAESPFAEDQLPPQILAPREPTN